MWYLLIFKKKWFVTAFETDFPLIVLGSKFTDISNIQKCLMVFQVYIWSQLGELASFSTVFSPNINVLDFWWHLPWIAMQLWIPHLHASFLACMPSFTSGTSLANIRTFWSTGQFSFKKIEIHCSID